MFSLDVSSASLFSSPSFQPHSDVNTLIHQLSTSGFALLSLPQSDTELLDKVLQEGRKMTTFRFPPVDGQALYSQVQKEGFKTLFKWSTYLLQSLLTSLSPLRAHTRTSHLLKRLESITHQSTSFLFGGDFFLM